MTTPTIFSFIKPPRVSSYSLVRAVKRVLTSQEGKKVKVGHFGTLDPFATGVLLVGVHGASRLNNFIHEELSKTYLAIGKLGVQTPTGDLTVEPIQIDTSEYLQEKIAQFDLPFLQEHLQKFVGEYWQAPHVYSAAKFQGKKLYEWAREGQEIKKQPVKRNIYHLEVVKYAFPYLIIRCEVSSGTYIRTLFQDIAKELGTLGSLVSLVRERVGSISLQESFRLSDQFDGDLYQMAKIDITSLLDYSQIVLPPDRARAFRNGLPVLTYQGKLVHQGKLGNYFWIKEEEQAFPIGLAYEQDQRYRVKFNFAN